MPMKSSLESHTLSILENYHGANNFYVGFSGGVDSHVLLYVMAQCQKNIKQEVIAVHVNHKLNKKSDSWVQHCQNVCNELNIKFVLVEIDARAPKGESQEEWSRNLRYDAVINLLGENDVFLTAHHKDDLAETLLLQLFRGAGPAGLSAIPEKIQFGEGWHIRPLLDFDRQQITEFASKAGLDWIDDNSNLDERFDRNYLRHTVMPVIKSRWPGILKTLYRSAKIQSDASRLLEQLAGIDMETCINSANSTLKQDCLNSLGDSRAINVVRYWLKTHGHRSPGATFLEQILHDVIKSEPDASPCVKLANMEIRRYRNMIFLTQNLPMANQINEVDSWDTEKASTVVLGTLYAEKNIGSGISINKITGKNFSIRYRNGHERIRLGGHHHSLKNIFQEHGIPPCFRGLIPLLFVDDTLVEITGLCIDEEYIATPDENALQVKWDRAKEIYAFKYIN